MRASRRPHQKTRTGCVSCKQKKIKCDESKPTCRYCIRHSISCIYRPPSSQSTALPSRPESSERSSSALPLDSPPSSLPSPTPSHAPRGEWTTLDLELLHFYTANTSSTFCSTAAREHVWRNLVPRASFSNPFLLYNILALAALHLSTLEPHRKDSLIAHASAYHNAALPLFRAALSDPTAANGDALCVSACLNTIYVWASESETNDGLFFTDPATESMDPATVGWVQLLRGASRVVVYHYAEIKAGPMRSIVLLDDWDEDLPDKHPEKLTEFAKLEVLWRDDERFSPEQKQTLDLALRCLKRTYLYVCRPPGEADATSVALAWPVRVPEAYLRMVSERQPAALVVLAHFCLALNRIEDFWWKRDASRKLLQKIHQSLGKEWESWISWPLQDLVLTEFRNKNEDQKTPV